MPLASVALAVSDIGGAVTVPTDVPSPTIELKSPLVADAMLKVRVPSAGALASAQTSSWQLPSQPSPPRRLPSSQASPVTVSITPLPQVSFDLQSALQPSPDAVGPKPIWPRISPLTFPRCAR